MTIEEKRRAIEIYCETKVNCKVCPLSNIAKYRDGCFSCESEEHIGEHYRLIYGDAEVSLSNLTDSERMIEINPIKPEYYNDTKITPFDVIDDWDLNFYLGNAIKYIKRAGKKANNSKLQDLKKVREYIDHEIKAEEAKQ